MPTPKLYQLRITSRMKKKRRRLSDDKKVVTDSKNFWHEMLSRLGLLVTVLSPRKKTDASTSFNKKRVLLEGNTLFKSSGVMLNFCTNLIAQYWYSNIFTAIAAVIFGHIYKHLAIFTFAVVSFPVFIIKSMLIIGLFLATVVAIYAVEEKYNIVPTISNEPKEYWLTKYDVIEVLHRMPQWLSNPEMETANWFNSLLSRLWPLVQHHLATKIDDVLGEERLLDNYIPFNEYSDFKVTKSAMGKKVPCISGIHVMTLGVKREVIVFDADIIYDSDLDFRISGAFQLLAGLRNLYFRTKLRITIGPLFRDKPTIGSISITFLNTPIIDWEFIGILRFLNANFLKNVISKILAAILRNPRCLTVNIAKYTPRRERNIGEPNGLLCVDVIEAKDLPRSEPKLCCRAKADAFCSVTVGDETKFTPVATFSDNPEWNKSFSFVYHQRKRGDVEVFIKDENFDSDLMIGGVVISVQQIINELNGREFNIQIRDPNDGAHVYNHLGYPSLLAIKISYFDLSAKIERMKTWNRLTRNMPVAALSVLIEYATGLETAAHQIQSPDMRPMVRVNVGNQTQVTSVKERSGAPLWDESLHFLLFSPKLEMVHIEVIDVCGLVEDSNKDFISGKTGKFKENLSNLLSSIAKKGTILGYVTLPVGDVLDAPGMKTEGFYQLEGLLEKANIKVIMAMRITEYSQAVIENYSKTRTMFPEEPEPLEKQKQNDTKSNKNLQSKHIQIKAPK